MSLDDDLRTLRAYHAKVALHADYVTRLMFWAHENEDYLDVITNKYLRLWALAGMGGGGTYATVRKRS